MNRVCDNCGRETSGQEQMYSIRIELFARTGPLDLTLDDLLADHTAQIEKLVEEMDNADVDEATDQVHEAYLFEICTPCRQRFHRLLKEKAKSKP